MPPGPRGTILFVGPPLEFLVATKGISLRELSWEPWRIPGARISLVHCTWRKQASTTHQQRILQGSGRCEPGALRWLAQSYISESWLSWDPELCDLLSAHTYQATSIYLLLLGPRAIKLHKALSWGSRMDCLISLPLFISLIYKTLFPPRTILPKGQMSRDHLSQVLHRHGHSNSPVLLLLHPIILHPIISEVLVHAWMNPLPNSS